MAGIHRRNFLGHLTALGSASFVAHVPRTGRSDVLNSERGTRMQYGLVTYMWAAEWDLPTLIRNCEQAQVHGVELRTTHAHGVEPSLPAAQRREVASRFSDSPVQLVGLGSNERFDQPDPNQVQRSIESTKQFIVLSHDVGATGVKVKPNDFHKDVPREVTIAQIGKALGELGAFGAGYGQQIRLEVHGSCAHLPDMRAIVDAAQHENVALCWNSNPSDLSGKGLDYNFRLVRDQFGATCHVRPLADRTYPYRKLIDLLVETDYDGWVMLEDGKVPEDPVRRLPQERRLFERMVNESRARSA